ncbi:MAG: hypothetical protein LUQ49_02605 [Methanomicrobiales archaeon]|nr:hypothetical protein [Methanomicrobiales archaeon]
MVPRFLLVLLALLVIAALFAGCGERATRAVPVTPVVTPEIPGTTPEPAMTVPETTPVPTTPAESFPDALSVGTPYRYGREDIAMEVTVYRAMAMDRYEFWSPQWGKYWNTTPGKGSHFLFALVRFIDRGTARARLPAPHLFVLHSGGNTYVETTDRDNSLRIRDLPVMQYEYFFERTAGWIDPAESNKVEGFLLFEVPESITPENSYLEATFSSQAGAVWKLG